MRHNHSIRHKRWIRYFVMFMSALISGVIFTTFSFTSMAQPSTSITQPSRQSSAPSSNTQVASISGLTEMFRRRVPPDNGTSLGERFCGLAPNRLEKGEGYPVWSDRPLFIWQGTASQIHVGTLSGQSLWSSSITSGNSIQYGAKQVLESGETYSWWTDNDSSRILFRVLSAEQRQEIEAIEELPSRGSNAEAIAVAQAYYFAQRSLWSDALRVIYLVSQPSRELVQAKQTILNDLVSDTCDSSSS